MNTVMSEKEKQKPATANAGERKMQMTTANAIAESILGPIEWISKYKGFCRCPGTYLHTAKTSKSSCIVYLNDVPTIYCFHQGCSGEIIFSNYRLRDAIWRAGVHPSTPPGSKKEDHNSLKLRAKLSKPIILKENAWSFEQMKKDSPVKCGDQIDQWHLMLGLFKPEEIIFLGSRWDSNPQNFKPAGEWMKFLVPQPFEQIGPAVYKDGVTARRKDQILYQPYMVVESDRLTFDESCAIFSWLKNRAKLNLKAIVYTGGKSLHAWYEMPSESHFKDLKIILPELGCDPAMLRTGQISRMPGAYRVDKGKFQTLHYFSN